MWVFYLCFLWISVVAAEYKRLYKGGSLQMEITVVTTDCYGAGSNSDLILTFGYLNLKNQLLYALESSMVRGMYDNNLEKNDNHYFKYDVPDAEFTNMEKKCHSEAIWPLWNQTIYEDCFHTNLLHIKMFTNMEKKCHSEAIWPLWNQTIYEDCFHTNLLHIKMVKQGLMSDWKPKHIGVSFWFTLKKGDILEHASSFSFNPDCDYDWVDGSATGFVCRERINKVTQYIRGGQSLEKGTKYNCNMANRKIRSASDRA
uniref:C-type lectin domain-containing protein n=1 Tax=Steinernema glaseri TaxID=37863 RepID=A0A1I7ZIX2_9BILA